MTTFEIVALGLIFLCALPWIVRGAIALVMLASALVLGLWLLGALVFDAATKWRRL